MTDTAPTTDTQGRPTMVHRSVAAARAAAPPLRTPAAHAAATAGLATAAAPAARPASQTHSTQGARYEHAPA
jgi:hypothetical protein